MPAGAWEVTGDNFARYLYLPDLPEVDLLIRTSGEQRISSFLPWHTAYAEIIFDNVLWPDFDRAHLLARSASTPDASDASAKPSSDSKVSAGSVQLCSEKK